MTNMVVRPRFSIAGLMVVVLVCAVGVAALRYASEAWAGAMFTLALGVLAAAGLGAVYRRGRKRAFWLGAAVFGWGYLAACFGPWSATEVRPHLITSTLLEWLYPRIHPQPPPPLSVTTNATWSASTSVNTVQTGTWQVVGSTPGNAPGGSGAPAQTFSAFVLSAPVAPSEPFQRIGHSLFGLLAALLGGLIAVAFFARRDEAREAPGSSSGSAA
jgi:hypothetical protein